MAVAVTGHYTEMIDPANQYVGYATFINPDARYSATTSGEYNKYDNNLDESFGPDISKTAPRQLRRRLLISQ